MLDAGTLEAVDAYWAAFLGVVRAELRPAEPRVVAHAELGDYRGMFAQSFGGAPVVSLPVELLEPFAAAVAGAAADGWAEDEDRWRAVFGERIQAIIGPAAVWCADAGTLRHAPAGAGVRTRVLGDADRPALDAFRSALSGQEWEHGGSELDSGPVIGAFAGGELAVVAGHEVWGERIAHLAIVTHPAHRGRGLGAAAVALAARTALDGGLIPQYRTLRSNTPSMSIARRLGFVPYATSLAVRLRAG
jgi:GNAT superfamily N-acetyltransferase